MAADELDPFDLHPFCANLTEMHDQKNCSIIVNSAELHKVVSRVVPIFFGLIGIIGLLGNSLVVVVVAANPAMRSTTNLLILNLAIADLFFVIFCVPFTATDYVMTTWPFGDNWCKIVQYLIVVTAHASVYTLVLMSLDRFLAVVHPITSMSLRTKENALAAIAAAWFFIVTTAAPVALCHSEIVYKENGMNASSCTFLESPLCSKVGFQLSFLLTSYVIPLTLIVGLYICMLCRLWKTGPGGNVSAESRRGKKKVTRMVVIVVAVFAICWCPVQVILVLKSLDLYDITFMSVIAQIFSQVLAYMNSCVNPLLYAFLSENFRVAFRKVMYCPGNRAFGGGGSGGPVAAHQTRATRTGTGNGSCMDIV